jgi:uncharacterized membrane protein
MEEVNTSREQNTMAGVVERNVRALVERQQREQANVPLQMRIADRVTAFAGSMTFVFLHLFIFGIWIVWNLPWTPFPKYDPSFVVLAMTASVEAIFLSTFVLITQNLMAERAAKRADLDLQIGLLAEYEVTRLITLVKRIAQRLKVDLQEEVELSELEKDVAPARMLDLIEQHEKAPPQAR